MDLRTLTTALAAAGILGLAALYGCQQGTETAAIPAKEDPGADMLNIAAHRPPLVIRMPNDADWHGPQTIEAPASDFQFTIAAPVLAPQFTSAELGAEFDDDLTGLESEGPAVQNSVEDSVPVRDLSVASAALPPAGPAEVIATSVGELLRQELPAGKLIQSTWTAGESLHGASIPTPVLIASGVETGPTLCVTAAVHGDELNGIESVRRLMYTLKPDKLSGTVIGVPIVNLQGFHRQSRYLSDRRDLNRFFPGNPRGSVASRMAYSFFNDVVSHCDGLVDLHTGSFHRTNLPQLRADLNNADVLALTKGFGATVILHSSGGPGTLRRSAADVGIPAVTLEAGEPLRLQEDAVEHTVKALFTLLDTMQMYDKRSLWGNPEPTYYSSAWVRAEQGGILLSEVKLGRRVKLGERLGTVTDPISNEQVPIKAPYAGRVIGMALNQFVMPGFATFHLATEAQLDEASDEEHYHSEGMDVAATETMGTEESE